MSCCWGTGLDTLPAWPLWSHQHQAKVSKEWTPSLGLTHLCAAWRGTLKTFGWAFKSTYHRNHYYWRRSKRSKKLRPSGKYLVYDLCRYMTGCLASSPQYCRFSQNFWSCCPAHWMESRLWTLPPYGGAPPTGWQQRAATRQLLS